MVNFAALASRPKRPPPLVPRLVVGVTGHRPHKLPDPATGYVWDNPLRQAIRGEIRSITEMLLARPPERCRPHVYTDADYLDVKLLSRVKWHTQPLDPTAPIAVSGVALGVDQDACGVWARMGLPYIALVPFPGQDSRWPTSSRRVYEAVLTHAAGIVMVSESPPVDDAAAGRMLRDRDEVLCCVVDELIAVWDGSRGGTSHTVSTWHRFGNYGNLHRIDPRDLRGA